MKICDICGQAVLDVDDFDFDKQTLDMCNTCYEEWQVIRSRIFKESDARLVETNQKALVEFLASKGYPHETPNNR